MIKFGNKIILVVLLFTLVASSCNASVITSVEKKKELVDISDEVKIEVEGKDRQYISQSLQESDVKNTFEKGIIFEEDSFGYFAEIVVEDEVLPIYVSCEESIDGKTLSKQKAVELIEEKATKYFEKNIKEGTQLKPEDEKANTRSVSTDYSYVGGIIAINVSYSGEIIFYQEYRWYYGGLSVNGNERLFFLRKDSETEGSYESNGIIGYGSTFTKADNYYEVNFLDAQPNSSSSTTQATISYPLNAALSLSIGSRSKITKSFDLSDDSVEWEVKETGIFIDNLMKNFQFTQGVNIESSKSNSRLTVKENLFILKNINPIGSNEEHNYVKYIYIDGTTSPGWLN